MYHYNPETALEELNEEAASMDSTLTMLSWGFCSSREFLVNRASSVMYQGSQYM